MKSVLIVLVLSFVLTGAFARVVRVSNATDSARLVYLSETYSGPFAAVVVAPSAVETVNLEVSATLAWYVVKTDFSDGVDNWDAPYALESSEYGDSEIHLTIEPQPSGVLVLPYEIRTGEGSASLLVFAAGFTFGCVLELFGLMLRMVRALRSGTGMEG